MTISENLFGIGIESGEGSPVRSAQLIGTTLYLGRAGASSLMVDLSSLGGPGEVVDVSYDATSNALTLTKGDGSTLTENLDAAGFMRHLAAP